MTTEHATEIATIAADVRRIGNPNAPQSRGERLQHATRLRDRLSAIRNCYRPDDALATGDTRRGCALLADAIGTLSRAIESYMLTDAQRMAAAINAAGILDQIGTPAADDFRLDDAGADDELGDVTLASLDPTLPSVEPATESGTSENAQPEPEAVLVDPVGVKIAELREMLATAANRADAILAIAEGGAADRAGLVRAAREELGVVVSASYTLTTTL